MQKLVKPLKRRRANPVGRRALSTSDTDGKREREREPIEESDVAFLHLLVAMVYNPIN